MSRFSNCRPLTNVNHTAQKFSSITAFVKNLKIQKFQQNSQQWRKCSGTLSVTENDNIIVLGSGMVANEQTEENIYGGKFDENVFKAAEKKIQFADKRKAENRSDIPDPKEAPGAHVSTLHTSYSSSEGRKGASADGGGTDIKIKVPFKLYSLEEGPATHVKLNKADAAKYYQHMQCIRRIENAADALYKAKIIRGFCHLYSGQEACAVGMKAALNEKDSVTTAYRAHGWTYLMGVPALGVLAELAGRATGCSRGKGGSMHTYGVNFYGGNGIVGSQVPLGTGISLQCKLQSTKGVSIACYGDGAANQGQVAESFNIAYLWKLPIIYVCENNQYGMGTAARRSSANDLYYTRGDLIPGIWVNGMDVLAVRSATEFAIDYVLKHGPIILEMHTYRYGGHSMSDPGLIYRPRAEVQAVRQKNDPISNFKNLCLEYNILTEAEMKEIDGKIKAEIVAAVNQAKKDPEVPLEELTWDISINCLEPKIRKVSGYTGIHKLTNKKAQEILKTMGQAPKMSAAKNVEKPKEATPTKSAAKNDAKPKKKKDDEEKK